MPCCAVSVCAMQSSHLAKVISLVQSKHCLDGASQVLCKTSGSTLGYGFPTMDEDDELQPKIMTEAVA